jgi:phosphate-selective porin OprO/OprP
MFHAKFNHLHRYVIASVLILAPICGVRVAHCGDDPNDTEIAELRHRLDELNATVRQIQERQESGFIPTSDAPSPPVAGLISDSIQQEGTDSPGNPTSAILDPSGPGSTVPAAGPRVPVSSSVPPRPTERQGIHTGGFPLAGWNEGFYLRSDDHSYELHITGQLQSDYRGYLQDLDTNTSPDTFLIRRARLGLEATLFQYYEFRLLPDFAGQSSSKTITDAYGNVHYWDAFQVEMGKFKQPFSYEELIQDRYTPFMERSLIDQMTPQRDEGIMIQGRKMFGDRFDYAVALSNGVQNDSTIATQNSKDLNTRMVARPFDKSNEWLHGLQFGCSYGVGVEGAPYGTNNVAVNPATLTTPSTVEWFAFNSTVLAAGQRTRVSPELEYFHGSFGFATQYFAESQRLRLTAGSPVVTVPDNGFYVMGSYLLTGEQRYDYTQQIDPINPFHAYSPLATPGAWEVLFRISRLDLDPIVFTDHLVSPTGQFSHEATECTLGANWYLNKWVRTQFNWEHAWFAEPIKFGDMPAALSHEDALYARFQVIF